MRSRLVLLVAAGATMVAIAFVVPLAALVSRVADERAVNDAERDVQLVVAGLGVSREFSDIELVITRTDAGAEGRLGVHFSDGSFVGAPGLADDRVEQAFADRRSTTVSSSGGKSVIIPVALGLDTVVVRADIGSDRLRAGVHKAWILLGVVGILLVGGSVIVTERLARNITRPMMELEVVSRLLASGDLSVRAKPAGPPETAELGRAFNHLAERVDDLLLAEREEVADLAHRLRTPLTALRLRLDLVEDSESRNELAEHVDRLELSVTELILEARRRSSRRAECIDIGSVITERVDWWGPLAEDVGMSLDVEISAPGSLVMLDRQDLQATMDVLIENLFAHVGNGSGRFSVDTIEEGVRVRCDDDGPGLDPDSVERGSSDGSTGLGLDIARRLTQGAGGRFWVGMRHGGGGRIEMWFPKV